MRVVIAGGTGLLGRRLWQALAARGDEVVALTRGEPGTRANGRLVRWRPDGGSDPAWAAELDGAGAVINVTGENIAAKRWTDARKAALRESRLLSTRSLVAAMRTSARRPPVFVQGSAVGYYGRTGDEPIDESFPPGDDFLGRLGVEWEAEARAAEALGCRVVLIRSGVVLAPEGGALKELARPFRFYVGGPVASGRQYLSWIHPDDWVRLIAWTIDRSDIAGAINATSPVPVTNEEFSTALGRTLHRPSWLRVPRLPLRLLFGEMADVVLVGGQRVVPRRATEAGFRFDHPEIDRALADALARRPRI
jgi:hypothetical protein